MKFSFRSHVFHSNMKKLKDDSKVDQKTKLESNQSGLIHNNKTGPTPRVSSRMKTLGNSKEEDSVSSQLYYQYLINRMEPRDQRIIIPYPNQLDLFDNRRDIDEWLGEMSFSVASAAFNMFSSKQLSYQETKVYFSQNLLLNILLFMENVKDHQVYETMKYFNTRLKDNLEYLKKKYPQAKQIKPNKKLREAVSAVNNMTNDDNDMLSKIQFQLQVDNEKKKEIFKKFTAEITNQKIQNERPQQLSKKRTQSIANTPNSTSRNNEGEMGKKQIAIKQQEEGQDQDEQVNGMRHELVAKQVQFSKKQDEDYTPEIMKLINYLISLPAKNCGKKDEKVTYFGKFLNTMQKIFDSAFFPSNYVSEEEIFQFVMKNSSQSLQQLISNKKRDKEKVGENLKEYQEKVKKYTSYKISQKINPNTEVYTESQISFGAFEVKSTAVLRVITKWIEQLEAKIKKAKEEILYRSFRFKTKPNQKQDQIKLSQNEKYDLYQSSLKKQLIVRQEEKKMIDQCIDIEGMLAKIGTEMDDKNANIPKSEFCVGKFCTQLGSAASVYLLNYLNKIIHSLLQIPEEAGDEGSEARKVSLITFKISDLIRCKCSSKQNQILRILNLIKKVDERKPELFKIIRIKDRLDLGTKDILINILFYQKIICEIQLEINDEVDEKQKMYDSFNHYLYQLSRSVLGPIMESACIWTHLDQRAKQVLNYIKKSNVGKLTNYKHQCVKFEMQPFKFSFVCSNCKVFYTNPIGVIKNTKCSKCKYYKCSLCKEKQMSVEHLKNELQLKNIQPFMNEFEEWNDDKKYLPDFAILIPKKSKKIQHIFAQKVEFLEKIYYVRTVENQEKNVSIVIIKQLRGQQKADRRQICEGYFVFQWKQKRLINRMKESPISRQLEREKQERKQKNIEKRRKQNEQKLTKLKLEREKQNARLLGLMSNKNQTKTQSLKIQSPKVNPVQYPVEIGFLVSEKIVEHFENQIGEETKEQIISDQIKQDEVDNIKYNETLTKLSYYNNLRICIKEVDGVTHILILNYIPSEDNLKIMLKEIINQTTIFELLESKKEVLMLEKQRINEDMIHLVLNSYSFNNVFSNVYYMYLDQNRITNLSFLSFFENLRVLHANSNEIEQMSDLKDLKHLEQIMLNNNAISEIAGVEGKKKLVSLSLDSNSIEVIKNLRSLNKLQKLSLSKNKIYVVQQAENLKSLKNLIHCDLSFNALTEIPDLNKSVNLVHLNLCANKIEIIQNLSQFGKLKSLNLSYNQITELKQLESNKMLQSLSFECNRIKQIANINHLTVLQNLNLSGNEIKRIQNIHGLTRIKNLNLSYNKIERLENLNYLINLQSLNLALNGFKKIDFNEFVEQLQSLKKLKTINLINNPINIKDKQSKDNFEKIVGTLSKVKITMCKFA